MNKIRELRTEKGLTQAELAEILGVNQTAVGKYERGELEPNIENLIKLSRFFEVSVDYIIGNADDFGIIQTPSDALTQEERQLLDDFRHLNTKNRMHVAAYAAVRREEQEKSGFIA